MCLMLGACSSAADQVPPEGPFAYSNTVALRTVHSQTGTLLKIAYAGSPVRKSIAYINSYAVEPGETWLDMGDIDAVAFGGWRFGASLGTTLRHAVTPSPRTPTASGMIALGEWTHIVFAEFNPSGKLTDSARTVAGHLDDEQANILGAYGATRD